MWQSCSCADAVRYAFVACGRKMSHSSKVRSVTAVVVESNPKLSVRHVRL